MGRLCVQLTTKDYFIYHLFRDYPYSSALEQAYCQRMEARRRALYEDINFWGTLAIIFLSLVLTYIIRLGGEHQRADIIYVSHWWLLGVMCLWPVARHMRIKKRQFLVPLNLSCMMSWALCVYDISAHGQMMGVYAPTTFAALIICFLIFFAYSNYILDIVAVIVGCLVVAAYWQHPDWLVAMTLNIWFVFGASSFNRIRCRANRIDFIVKFREQSRYLPRQVLWRGIVEDKQIDEVFLPANRTCVCLSSDWRNYQDLTSRYTPAKLAELLSRYYRMTNDVLEKCIPSGNYFCDWIADELFVVLFTDLPDGERHLWEQAIEFGVRLIQQKNEFLQSHGAPEAIDIGIAGGDAFVGMMGPSGQAKTTALGEVPGKARRIQTLGKDLRMELGEQDRVIFVTQHVSSLTMLESIKTYELKDYQKVRSIEERRFFYVEPMTAGSSRLSDAQQLRKIL